MSIMGSPGYNVILALCVWAVDRLSQRTETCQGASTSFKLLQGEMQKVVIQKRKKTVIKLYMDS